MQTSLDDTDIIAPNFKKRLSGVTSTIIQLVPLQRKDGLHISTLGPGLPESLPSLRWLSLLGLWKRPTRKPFRIWHARRNIEMAFGILLRDVFHMRIKLLFTSVAQRHHKPFTKWLIRRMDKVIAASSRSGSYLEVPYELVMHGIDVERFHPPLTADDSYAASGLPGTYAITCSGRIRPSKGTDLFVDAMIALLPKYPEWTAIITGRTTAEFTDFEKQLRDKITKAGLQNRILILGEVDDVRIWYRRATLYVAPSRNEGFGLTPLEAMASQTAVVASDAGAYAELLTEETGRVVPAGDGDALIQAIEPYLANPTMAVKAGEKALTHVRQSFPLEKEANGIAKVYDEIFSASTR